MLSYEIINNPTKGTINILLRKIRDQDGRDYLDQDAIESIALIQGPVAQIIAAADIAEKTADIIATEVGGACPQHITMIALFGTISAVSAAVDTIKKKYQ